MLAAALKTNLKLLLLTDISSTDRLLALLKAILIFIISYAYVVRLAMR